MKMMSHLVRNQHWIISFIGTVEINLENFCYFRKKKFYPWVFSVETSDNDIFQMYETLWTEILTNFLME